MTAPLRLECMGGPMDGILHPVGVLHPEDLEVHRVGSEFVVGTAIQTPILGVYHPVLSDMILEWEPSCDSEI